MKRLLLVFVIIQALAGLALSQNLSGALSGNLGPATYTVIDSIWVAASATLTLAPGTTFEFAGAFGFGVAGTLTAIGTATDSIKFIPATGVPFWKGIDFIVASGTTGTVQYCLITGANTSGIYIDHAGPAISHCTFINNGSQEMGGGIYSMYGTGSISDCYFANNTALHGGGAVIRYTPVNVTNCVFTGNNGTYGGAMAYYFSSVCNLTNCVFYGNSGNAGGGIRFSSAPVNVINCTFTANSAAQGSACFNINQTSTYKNCIFWGNTGSAQLFPYAGSMVPTYCDIQDTLWPGPGNINLNPLFVAGPNGAYYLSQIAAGQSQNSPCMDTGDPASTMIAGTTRTDQVQDAGVVDMGYHYYTAGAPPPALDVTLTPLNPPIVIPARGGNFNFNISLTRLTGPMAPYVVWARIKNPDGTYTGNTLGPVTINTPIGVTITRTRTQTVPGTWVPGVYLYLGYVNIAFGYPAIDSSSFNWTKSTTADGGPTVWEAICSGELFPGEVSVSAPAAFTLAGAYPNPFNPMTTISFTLPQTAQVILNVYDVSGRQVAQLVNGWREVGSHQVTFDGANLSSGMYLYTLTAGNQIVSGKMVLMK